MIESTLPESQPATPIPPVAPEPFEVSQPTSPTVIIPRKNSSVPGWFYFIFMITVILFLLVTAFLVMQLKQKQKFSNIEAVPTIMPKVIPTIVVSPVISPAASEAASLQPNTMGSTDEVTSIDADLKNTDLTQLNKGIEALDLQMNNTNP